MEHKTTDDLTITHEPAPAIAADIFGSNLDKAEHYHDLLATIGAPRGFIGPKEVPRLWHRHILNCAVLGEAIDTTSATTVADIGSGAGLPGIPLALARPDLAVILIEPLLKRSTFLHEVVAELGLANVTVVRGRAEEKPVRRQLPRIDVVTSRAVAPLGKLTHWSLPLLDRGGVMMAMKGESVQEEWNRDRATITKAGGGSVKIFTVGSCLEQPTTVISIRKVR